MSRHHLVICAAATVLTLPCLAQGQQPMPSNHPKIDLPAQSETHQESTRINGKVLQTMDSGGYSYVELQKKGGEKVWLAVPSTSIKSGSQMSFKEGVVMTNFESKTLKRTFPSIVFSNGIIDGDAKAAPKAAVNQAIPQGASHGSSGSVAGKEKISVPKAFGENAYTVEGIYNNSTKLDKKKVAVRGKVIKVSSGIMKRTWIHIQDGTGSEAAKNHNLVCTTTADAKVGEVVTISGTLARNRDFGSGYKYAVIVENATVSRK